jgi:hypothetical protein
MLHLQEYVRRGCVQIDSAGAHFKTGPCKRYIAIVVVCVCEREREREREREGEKRRRRRKQRDTVCFAFLVLQHCTGIMESVPEFGCDKELLPLDKALLYCLCYGAAYLPFIAVDPRAINVPDSELDALKHCLLDLSCSRADSTTP